MIIIDVLLVHGLGMITQAIAAIARRIQSGYINSYATVIATGTVMFLAYLIWQMMP